MNKGYKAFLETWDDIVFIVALVLAALSVITIIYHIIKVATIKEYKQKYDYLRDNDAKMIFYSFVFLGLSITLFINTTYTETVKLSVIWLFVRLFVSISLGTLIIYLAHLILKYAYPSTLEVKLNKWRYKPRTNPKTGNVMKLLSEEEEDVHLDEGMQAEENVFSVDYDVWVDEQSGDVHIEKYAGHLQAYKCNTCGFQTMKQVKEEIIKSPTEDEEGISRKSYECGYCGAKRHKEFTVAKLSASGMDYKLPSQRVFKEDLRVQSISLEIHVNDGSTKHYEFQNTSQAKNFLEEFDLDSVNNL